MFTRDLIIRCYAEKRDNLWVAVCIDLSLAAQADTFQEAAKKLHAQILDFVLEAVSEPEYAGQLLSRKAPFSQVARFHFIKSASKLHFIKESLAKAFSCALPLTPDTRKIA